MSEWVIPAGTPLATKALQAGDTNRIVKWGDHSLTQGAPAPGVQAPAHMNPLPNQGRFQGLFKSFGLS